MQAKGRRVGANAVCLVGCVFFCLEREMKSRRFVFLFYGCRLLSVLCTVCSVCDDVRVRIRQKYSSEDEGVYFHILHHTTSSVSIDQPKYHVEGSNAPGRCVPS